MDLLMTWVYIPQLPCRFKLRCSSFGLAYKIVLSTLTLAMALHAKAVKSAPNWHQSLLAEVEKRLAYPRKSWHYFLGEPRLAVVFGSPKSELE